MHEVGGGGEENVEGTEPEGRGGVGPVVQGEVENMKVEGWNRQTNKQT